MAKTKKPVEANNGITDISHEEVKEVLSKSGFENAPAIRLMTPEETAEQEIKKFNLADSAIAALKDKYGSLVISGPDDKEGYKVVREAWGDVRSKRTGLEKKGKELRDGYNLISKRIIREEGRLIELLTPLEAELHEKWKAIDLEKERVQREKEEAEQAELMARIEQLQKLGMILEGGFYSIGGVISVDAATLRSMPEEAFLRLKTNAQRIFDQEQAEKEKAAQEKKREAEELKRQQEEVVKQWQEMKKQQEEIRAQQDQLRRDQENAAREKFTARINKFEALGMMNRGHDLYFHSGMGSLGLSVPIDHCREFTNEAFSELLTEVTVKIKDFKEKKEKYDADLKAELEAKAKAKAIEEAKREEERKAEDEKQKNLALNDDERFRKLTDAVKLVIQQVSFTQFKTKKYQQQVIQFMDQLSHVLKNFE